MKTKLFILACALMAATSADAQGLLGKIKKKLDKSTNTTTTSSTSNGGSSSSSGEVMIEDTSEIYSDDFGYSGKYTLLNPEKISSNSKEVSKEQTWQYVREENGNVVNKLYRYVANKPLEGKSYAYTLDEKLQEKASLIVFKTSASGSSSYYNYLMKLEDGVFGFAKVDGYKGQILEYYNTFAKDVSKLSDYDLETGAAIMQSLLDKAKSAEADAARTKWMRNDTYAKMKGKIGFIDQYSKVAYNRNDITEKVDVFMTSAEIGKSSIFYRAYYDTPGNVICSGCELNTTFEIGDVKVSRIEQRKTSSKWSRMIKQKFVDDNFFSAAPTIVSFGENIADYAFLYTIYQNKDKFVEGASIPMKVTLTTNQDGVDKDVLAEGTITLVYKGANKAGFDKMIKWVDDLLDQ